MKYCISHSPHNWLGYLLLALLAINTWHFGLINGAWKIPTDVWSIILYTKTLLEAIASFYATFYLLIALCYKQHDKHHISSNIIRKENRMVLAYLCCDDLDTHALESIVMHCQDSCIRILVHDDSSISSNRLAVNTIVSLLNTKYKQNIEVIRRGTRDGGKPGAVNNVLKYIPDDMEYLLLCDSDSYFYSSDAIIDALTYFDNQDVALIQFRNVGHICEDDGAIFRYLSSSINFYDSFVYFMDRFGWSPFLGHNAILRISVMKEMGGFTPGQLADDIDYSVKLKLHGYKIRYIRDVVCGERHPMSYEALRRRTRKWTYGCTDILLRWGWQVLTANQLTLMEKLTFFLTVSYYNFQVLLLGYLVIFYILFPLYETNMGGAINLLQSAGLLLLLTYLPSLSYFSSNKMLSKWPCTAAIWGIVYGSQDFVMLGAFFRCLLGKKLAWTPTNFKLQSFGVLRFLPELTFGNVIILIAATQYPILLLLPTTLLFVGKFLAAPTLNKWAFKTIPSPFKRS